jgi:hypothetical protein
MSSLSRFREKMYPETCADVGPYSHNWDCGCEYLVNRQDALDLVRPQQRTGESVVGREALSFVEDRASCPRRVPRCHEVMLIRGICLQNKVRFLIHSRVLGRIHWQTSTWFPNILKSCLLTHNVRFGKNAAAGKFFVGPCFKYKSRIDARHSQRM